MQANFKSRDVWLLVIVSLMAFGANLPESVFGNVIDRNLLLAALAVTIFIALFRYLRLMLFLTVSVLAIGANLPDQLATQFGISRTAFIIASGVLVVIALLYKLYDRQKALRKAVAEQSYAGLPGAEATGVQMAVSHLRDTLESRASVLAAISNGDFAALHQLLISDVEVNFSQDGQIPIFLAIEKGNVDVVLLLLIHGAKLRIKNHLGLSPIDVALKLRFARIAKILHYADTQNMAIQNRAVYSAQQTRKMAVLFADICGSTALYDQMGNEAALNMITSTLNLLKQEVAKHKGTLIKTIGDEIMCTFPNVMLAAKAARAMHLAIDTEKPGGELPIAVRIGLHFGDVILKANDVFGDTVNVAARVASITRAQQTLTTQDVIDVLPEEFDGKVIPITRASFRGKQDALAVFQLLWEPEGSLSNRIGDETLRKLKASTEETSTMEQSIQFSRRIDLAGTVS
ncbi:adenylate/guanylate cyclase domain-containing protein [Sideroxydans lithotrophicus]|uniref:Adenylate/guanylate cyclase n=1 Tax=Sideroxydans lithotrophicus (strain ES-1) TaxID=580332 RepID=D5CUN9_SIDLE|nr:adenylate/guanylate cyclase domain-containing protein [Sideroxydans lithotrophicus]ADE12426.1 adenylate/guanylate cyclase [Sideroxydans lithotrophicus ES-1]